jgi:hypothetical protein
MRYLLSERKGMRATLMFIAKTKRLEMVFGNMTPPKEKDMEK